MTPVLAWLAVWSLAMLAIFGLRPKRKNKFTRYTPPPDERDSLRFWRNSWRS